MLSVDSFSPTSCSQPTVVYPVTNGTAPLGAWCHFRHERKLGSLKSPLAETSYPDSSCSFRP